MTETTKGGRTGAQILAAALAANGVDLAFGIPGESYLALLDTLYDHNRLKFVICRQEGGATMMADAYAKLTGRTGVAMVTRGPGATNASSGLHVAFQDSSPLVLLVGQVARDMTEREAFQEIDYRRAFGQLAKWVAEIDDPKRIPEMVNRAFATAQSGRPGPVVLSLPEDMLTERAEAIDLDAADAVTAWPAPARMQDFHARLTAAKRPLILIGGGGWSAAAASTLAHVAAASNLPVAASFRCQDFLDNSTEHYVGVVGIGPNPVLGAYAKDADLIVAIGARLGEITTGSYTLLTPPRSAQGLVHVHPDPEELGRVYQPDLAINAGSAAFIEAWAALPPVDGAAWSADTARLRQSYLDFQNPVAGPGNVQMAEIVRWLSDRLPDDAVIANGGGNYTIWVHRYYRYRGYRTQLAPTSGSMGYGLPAAVAAKIAEPDRTVVCFAGDGCFQMTMQEFGTAVQARAAIIVVVVDNASYGTIRMHQEREYPTRVIGTDLTNPDFAALARSYGAFGATVTETAQFEPAFEEALGSGRPAILHVKIPVEALTPARSLSEIRQDALDAGR